MRRDIELMGIPQSPPLGKTLNCDNKYANDSYKNPLMASDTSSDSHRMLKVYSMGDKHILK